MRYAIRRYNAEGLAGLHAIEAAIIEARENAMASSNLIRRITLSIPVISDKTRWAFVQIETKSGSVGVGEATLNGQEAALGLALRRIAPSLIEGGVVPGLARRVAHEELPDAAIVSALDQALNDLAARRHGKSLCEMLGQRRATVGLYANINRRTEDRTPRGFVDSARLALAHGFQALKLAPFDEVTPATASLALASKGIERIAAVKAVLPADAKLYVDCHWRFTPAIAAEMIAPLRACGVTWFECPIPEAEEHIADLRSLRHQANAAGMFLVGLEKGIGSATFETFAKAGAYDVMMPDIKYIGGIDVMLKTADILGRYGVIVSPHNPTGPVCHAASLAICGALESVGLLEVQFDETPLFDKLVGGVLTQPREGQVMVPTSPGLGVALDMQALRALPCDYVEIY